MNHRWKEYAGKIKEIGMVKCLLIIVCGILLIALSFPEKQDKEKVVVSENESKERNSEVQKNNTFRKEENDYVRTLEKELEESLEKVEGIGKTKVMITLKSTSESVLNKDSESEKSERIEGESQTPQKESSSSDKFQTTLLENEDGSYSPYVTKTISPEIEGVLVIAQGAENSTVAAEISQAVSVLFSVSLHKVKVMRMIE